MQFIVRALDHTDPEALSRRLAARAPHLELAETMRREGKFLYAVALLNDKDQMIGSVMIVDMPSRTDIDQWLSIEPYVKGNVWNTIDIQPCRVGPSFANK